MSAPDRDVAGPTALRGRTSPARIREAVSVAVARGSDPHALGLPALAVTNVLLAMGRGAPVSVHPLAAAPPSRTRGPDSPDSARRRAARAQAELRDALKSARAHDRETRAREVAAARALRREADARRAALAVGALRAGTLSGRLDAQAALERERRRTLEAAGVAWWDW